MVYRVEPSSRTAGQDWWQIGRILRVLNERCEREPVKNMTDSLLRYSPEGTELRQIPNSIRGELVDWESGETIAFLCKILMGTILEETQQSRFPIPALRLSTYVLYDPHKTASVRLENR